MSNGTEQYSTHCMGACMAVYWSQFFGYTNDDPLPH